jgi:hypothetical protein
MVTDVYFDTSNYRLSIVRGANTGHSTFHSHPRWLVMRKELN